jgi:hypothetical protein
VRIFQTKCLHKDLKYLKCHIPRGVKIGTATTPVIWVLISRRMRCLWRAVGLGMKRNAYRVLVEKPKRKISLCRPRRRWEDNINMNLKYDLKMWI